MHLPTVAKTLRPLLAKSDPAPLQGDHATSIEHLAEMLDQIESGEVTGEKGHRWLGWAQAVICCRGGATLEELKLINSNA